MTKISSPTLNGLKMASIVPPMTFDNTSRAARPKVSPPTPETPRMEEAGTPNSKPALSTETAEMAITAKRVITV